MDLVASYGARFFEEFARGARVVDRAVAGSAALGDLFDVRLAPGLARWVDFLATHERSERYGAFGWFGGRGGWTIDWLPGAPQAGAASDAPDANALAHALAQPFRYPALLAGGIAIGCDRDGSEWVVPIDHADEEAVRSGAVTDEGDVPVFVIDHDEGDLRVAADSLTTFAALLVVLERDGVPSDEEKAALGGRIDPGRFGLRRAGIASIDARVGAHTPIARRYAVAGHLRACLAENPNMDAPARPSDDAFATDAHASAIVTALLTLWVRGEETMLDAALARYANHRARFVRDAVARVTQVRQGPRVDPAAAPSGRDNDAYLRVCALLRT